MRGSNGLERVPVKTAYADPHGAWIAKLDGDTA